MRCKKKTFKNQNVRNDVPFINLSTSTCLLDALYLCQPRAVFLGTIVIIKILKKANVTHLSFVYEKPQRYNYLCKGQEKTW